MPDGGAAVVGVAGAAAADGGATGGDVAVGGNAAAGGGSGATGGGPVADGSVGAFDIDARNSALLLLSATDFIGFCHPTEVVASTTLTC